MTDIKRDFGQGNGHCFVRHLADPGVHLLLCQEFLQSFQGLQMVRHDQDHGGLLLAQRHVQHIDAVHLIIIEVIQSWKWRVKMGILLTFTISKTIFSIRLISPPLIPTPKCLEKRRLSVRTLTSCNSIFYLSNMLKYGCWGFPCSCIMSVPFCCLNVNVYARQRHAVLSYFLILMLKM